MAVESYYEKRKRILKEQKKRFEARKIAGGSGDASNPKQRPVKKPTSKLAALPLSGVKARGTKSRLNPSVDYGEAEKKADAAKKKKMLARRTKSPGALGGRLYTKSPGALGGKVKKSTTSSSSKTTTNKEKYSSFGAAFKAARKEKGPNKTFMYKGKKYSTATKDDIKKAKTKPQTLKAYLNKKNAAQRVKKGANT